MAVGARHYKHIAKGVRKGLGWLEVATPVGAREKGARQVASYVNVANAVGGDRRFTTLPNLLSLPLGGGMREEREKGERD